MENNQNQSSLLTAPGLEEVRKILREKVIITPQISEEMSQTVRRQEALVDSMLRAYTMYDNGIPIRPTLGNEMQIMYMRERQTLSFLMFPELLKLARRRPRHRSPPPHAPRSRNPAENPRPLIRTRVSPSPPSRPLRSGRSFFGSPLRRPLCG